MKVETLIYDVEFVFTSPWAKLQDEILNKAVSRGNGVGIKNMFTCMHRRWCTTLGRNRNAKYPFQHIYSNEKAPTSIAKDLKIFGHQYTGSVVFERMSYVGKT